MNKTEAAYAELLELRRRAGEIEEYRFEAVKLRLAKLTSYLPDFFVLLSSGLIEFHEVKGGLIRDDAMVKFKVAAEQFWWAKWIMVQRKRNNQEWHIILEI